MWGENVGERSMDEKRNINWEWSNGKRRTSFSFTSWKPHFKQPVLQRICFKFERLSFSFLGLIINRSLVCYCRDCISSSSYSRKQGIKLQGCPCGHEFNPSQPLNPRDLLKILNSLDASCSRMSTTVTEVPLLLAAVITGISKDVENPDLNTCDVFFRIPPEAPRKLWINSYLSKFTRALSNRPRSLK